MKLKTVAILVCVVAVFFVARQQIGEYADEAQVGNEIFSLENERVTVEGAESDLQANMDQLTMLMEYHEKGLAQSEAAIDGYTKQLAQMRTGRDAVTESLKTVKTKRSQLESQGKKLSEGITAYNKGIEKLRHKLKNID